ncbi:MAG: hypothetical protein DI535_02765 [Citrobacter freundii]|nr:MAG: hypothetical protein DI535_02765 [Citrobacter freundii]
MKRILANLCVFLAGILHSHGQINQTVNYTHTVVYDYTLQPDTTDANFKVSETMLLHIGKDYSNFLARNLHRKDSMMLLLKKEVEADPHGQPQLPPPGARPENAKVTIKVLKEYTSKKYYFSAIYGIQYAQYVEAMPVINWQIFDEERKVAGYLCKKATTSFAGRDYVAWFTPEIEISDGPYKFTGLPGLILSMYDTRNHHVFTAQAVFKEPKSVELEEKSGPLAHSFANRKEFILYTRALKSDPAKMFEQNLIKFPEDVVQRVVENAKVGVAKSNNPIELQEYAINQ